MKSVTNEMLRDAYISSLQRLRNASSLEGDAWTAYEQQVAAAFEDDQHISTSTAQFNGDFYLLKSTCTYVGYPGDNQLVTELPIEATKEEIGEAVRQVLSASRRMMYEYLMGTQLPLERAAGMARAALWLEEVMQRRHYKTKRAMLKSMNLVYIKEDDRKASIVFLPSSHVSLEGYEGLGEESSVSVSALASTGELGSALLQALSRCVGPASKRP